MVKLWKKVIYVLSCFCLVFGLLAVAPSPVVDLFNVGSVTFVSVADAAPAGAQSENVPLQDSSHGNKYNLGNSGILKSLEDVFSAFAKNGIQRLRPHIVMLIFLLGIISLCTNWSLYEGQMRLSMIIGSIIKIGFFFWLAVAWGTLTQDIFDSLQQIGLVAAGSKLEGEEFMKTINGSAIVQRGFWATEKLYDSMSIWAPGEALCKVIGIMLVLFSHVWIAFEVFITRVEFFIFQCLAFVFMPFGVLQHTSFLFQRCVSGVFQYGAKLMVMTFLVGLCEAQINWQGSKDSGFNPLGLGEESTVGDIFVVAVSLLLLAYLVYKSGELAQGIASGSPSMSGGGMIKNAVGTMVKGAAMVAGATMISAAANSGDLETSTEKSPGDSKVGDAAGTVRGQSASSSEREEVPRDTALGRSPSPVPAAKPAAGSKKADTEKAAGGVDAAGAGGSGGGAGGDTKEAAGAGGSGGGAGGDTKEAAGAGAADGVKSAAGADGADAGAGSNAEGAADGKPGGTEGAPQGGAATQLWNKITGAPAAGKKRVGAMLKDTKAGKVVEGASNIGSKVSHAGAKATEAAGSVIASAGEAVDRPALQSLDKAAEGWSKMSDAVKSQSGAEPGSYNPETLKQFASGAAQFAGGLGAAAGHGVKKVTGSKAARIAKGTVKILARAALMRNPITATFYGEMNKFRNDYLREQQFRKNSETGQRQIFHPDSDDQWTNQNA